ncbi:MAG: hypothetical protein MI749_07615 [Desulfovibrionales bacterium]|nr:hypothetical protein [Desulfovibrionales bacterium]
MGQSKDAKKAYNKAIREYLIGLGLDNISIDNCGEVTIACKIACMGKSCHSCQRISIDYKGIHNKQVHEKNLHNLETLLDGWL